MNTPPFSGTELFTQSTAVTLADLMGLVETAPFKTAPLANETRRRRVLGSLGRMARILGKPPEGLVLDQAFLDRLRKVKPRLHGIGKRSWQNILVDFRYVCRKLLGLPMGRNPAPMSPAWKALINPINDLARKRLYRFARWCSKNDIDPENVDDEVAARFRAHLETTSLKKPYHSYRVMARFWNERGGIDPNWPAYRFEVTDQRRTRTLPLEAFPASFAADIDHWARQVSADNLGDWLNSSLEKPLSPRTVKTRRHQLLVLATAVVRAGIPIEDVTGLAVFADPDIYKRGLEHLHKEFGGKTPWLENVARGFLPVARHYVGVPENVYRDLQQICRKVRLGFRPLNEKNRRRLLPFEDPALAQQLLGLAEATFASLARVDDPVRPHALEAQSALAVAILLVAPIRLANLVSLEMDKHLLLTGRGRAQTLKLLVSGDEVKNGLELSYPLPSETARLVQLYRARYLPLLAPGGTACLFPGQTKTAPKTVATLSRQISAFLLEHLGVEMNVHLFRHLAALLFLRQNPGQYVVVQQLLGHKSVETTVRFYAILEQEMAVRAYHDILFGKER